MRRVVLDANIYVSALGFGGVAQDVVSAGVDGEFYLIASDLIRLEVEAVLQRRFNWDAERLTLLETGLWSCANFVSSQKQVEVCRDPKDNHLLETSWESGADLLVSGDKDLLVLSSFEGTQIVSLRSFADELAAGRR
jgi:uncharacterized protein